MNRSTSLRVLFTGYAPVHFVCFMPLYECLRKMPGVEVLLSGGLRTKSEHGLHHDEAALYTPFGIDPHAIIPTDDLADHSFDLLFAANTKMIAPGKVGARVQIFHGISFRNKAVRRENMNADYYFIVGPYMQRRFVESGLMTADDPRKLSVGFMKTDRLLNRSLDRAELLSQYGFDGTRPVLLYAPTGQKYNSLETMGESVIKRIAACDKFDLIIKPHDHPKNTKINWFDKLKSLCGAHVKLTSEPDVIPLLFVADLLITDASSVSSEYSLLDRPILFLDVPRLLERAQSSAGSQLDLDSWGRHVGLIASTPDEVVPMIDASLSNPSQFAPQRQAMAADLFYNPGSATEAAVDWFKSAFPQSPVMHRVPQSDAGTLRARGPIAPAIHFDDSPDRSAKRSSAVVHKITHGGEKK